MIFLQSDFLNFVKLTRERKGYEKMKKIKYAKIKSLSIHYLKDFLTFDKFIYVQYVN